MGLSKAPIGKLNLKELIEQLGFVQLDTIRVVSRAHHHILWSRNQNYREPMLNKLLAKDRAVFEHFTHDASVLPMSLYPMWQRQFRRLERKVRKWEWHRGMLDADGRNALKDRIRAEGPLCTDAFDTKVPAEKKQMWSRPPHKLALDYMWYAGELSTSHRVNFKKFYDLTERVIPNDIRAQEHSDADQIDWLSRAALERLGFCTSTELKQFWDATSTQTTRSWINENKNDLVPVEIETADKSSYTAFALSDIEARLTNAPAPTSRLRILNPFDPAIRDRKRLKNLFGFDYTVEMFVPAAKRKWGYYVYPLLEGDRFLGRADIKADRKSGTLNLNKLWVEPKIKWTEARATKFHAELQRLTRLANCETIMGQN